MHTESARVVGLPETAVYQQQFTVRYDYPVYFTDGVFDRDNPLFEQVLRRFEPAKRHRFVVFVDANVAASWPALAYDIAAYARLHDAALELVAEPELVPPGEQSKNDAALVTRLQQRMADLAIDRHSFVVGIGGGASTSWATWRRPATAACATCACRPRCSPRTTRASASRTA